MSVASVQAAVAEALGVGVASSRALSGGMVGSVQRLWLEDGRSVVAKTSPGGALEVEAYMLRVLGERSPLPVPEVVFDSDELLVMTWLPGRPGLASAAAQRHFAELLAGTHAVEGPAFGLPRDTRLGPFDLPNGWWDDGAAFFREARLRWALGLARESGALAGDLAARVERVASRVPALLEDHVAVPSLLHGDAWSGNVLCEDGRVTGVVDPALHYGEAETELAFVDLFGGVGEAFWGRYREARAVPEAFFVWRRSLWQLAPLLVHVALFGRGYVPPLQDRLDVIEAQLP